MGKGSQKLSSAFDSRFRGWGAQEWTDCFGWSGVANVYFYGRYFARSHYPGDGGLMG